MFDLFGHLGQHSNLSYYKQTIANLHIHQTLVSGAEGL